MEAAGCWSQDVAERVLTQTTQPSFGFMVAQNLTTLMESWRSDATHAYGSKNHVDGTLSQCASVRVSLSCRVSPPQIMFGSESAFFLEYLAGLRRDGSGGLLVVRALFLLTGQQKGRTDGVCRACVRRRSHTC